MLIRESRLSSTLCRFLIYFISIRYKFNFSCFIYLLNTKNGYAKKHSHHEESPKAILTLLQPPLKGRTHLYYYITKKRKIVNTISVIFLFLQKQTFFKFKQSFYACLIVSFTILYQSTIIIYFCLCQLNIKIIISVLIYSFINFKY